MSKGKRHTKLASISLTFEDIAQIWWLANKDSRSFSWVAREAIARGLPLLCKDKNFSSPPEFKDDDDALEFIEKHRSGNSKEKPGSNLNDLP